MSTQFQYKTRVLNDGRQIIDELCECAHAMTEHGPRYQIGHGKCTHKACNCEQYSWVRWVFRSQRKRSVA